MSATSKFLRQYSHLLAAVGVCGYQIATILTPTIHTDIFKENFYQLNDRHGNEVKIGPKVEEKLISYLYRLNLKENKVKHIDFFYTRDNSYVSLGSLTFAEDSGKPALCGVPITISAESGEDLHQLLPNGYGFSTEIIKWDVIAQRDYIHFENTLLLSEDAKAFAVIRELYGLERPTYLYRSLNEMAFLTFSFFAIHSNNRSKIPKYLFGSRLMTYVFTGLVTCVCLVACRSLDKLLEERYKDERACELGLDLCEGAIEYYDKLQKRNAALRYIHPNGAKFVDEKNNMRYETFQIPKTNFHVKIPKIYENLEARKQECERNLRKNLSKFVRNFENDVPKKVEKKEDDKQVNKELEIFRNLRLKLQNKTVDEKK